MKKLQTILLTGVTGFLGSHLLKSLVSNGFNVIILKRSTSNTWRIEGLIENCVCYDVDIQPIEKAFEDHNIDIVLHTACCYGRNNESVVEIVDSNLILGLQVLDACIKFQTKYFLNTDTLLERDLNIYTL